MATVLKIGEREYRVKFNYNCFCDTDLLDRVNDLGRIFQEEEVQDDKDVTGMGRIKELFCCVRDLLFVGFKKHNPVETVQEIGDLLDQYKEETPEGEKRGILSLFTVLSNELMEEGFLSDMMREVEEAVPKVPQDHKKTTKKK